jgi:hypothetical protein
MLTRTTVNRYLRDWGYDHTRMTRAPAAVRFQARRSNELWQFDLSPSDLKEVEKPLWSTASRAISASTSIGCSKPAPLRKRSRQS